MLLTRQLVDARNQKRKVARHPDQEEGRSRGDDLRSKVYSQMSRFVNFKVDFKFT